MIFIEISVSNRLHGHRAPDLAVHRVELVVEGHREVRGCARGHMCNEGRLALVHRVVHVHPSLADLHVLETRLDAERKRENVFFFIALQRPGRTVVNSRNTIKCLIIQQKKHNRPCKLCLLNNLT